MNTVANLIEKLCRYLAGLAFFVIIVSVTIQLIGRNILSDSPLWTEELSRFGLLFLAAFGLGPSLPSGDLVNVDLFCESLKGRAPWVLRLVVAVITAAFCVLLLQPAWQFMEIGSIQTSPALGWRMDFIQVSMLIAVLSLLAFSVLRIIGMLLGTTNGLPEHLPLEEDA